MKEQEHLDTELSVAESKECQEQTEKDLKVEQPTDEKGLEKLKELLK